MVHPRDLRSLVAGLLRPGVAPVLLHMWGAAGVRLRDVALPLILALLVSLVEGSSFAFLIPLGDGVAAGSFAFIDEAHRFGWVASLVPDSMASPEQRDLALAIALLLLLLLGRLLKTALELLRAWWITARDRRYVTEVGGETFGRVVGFGALYFHRRPLGHIDAEISWAASAVDVLSHLEGLFMHAVKLVVKVVLVLLISAHLFAFLVISLLIVAAFTHLTSRRETALATSSAILFKAAHRDTLDTLSNMPMVKALEQETSVTRAYTRRLARAESLRASLRRTRFLKAGVIESTVLVAALGGEALILLFVPGSPAGHLARFCAFFVVAQQCLPDIQEISEYVTHLINHVPKLEALARLFDGEAKFVVPSGSRQFTGLRESIEIGDLQFEYDPAAPVLESLAATIPAGRITALVGSTGSGKSTLAHLLLRVYDSRPGTIFFDGEDVRSFDLASFRRRAFLVSQEPWILDRSLRDNLCFGLAEHPSDEALWKVLHQVALADHFTALGAGLDAELGSRGAALSGGQRQRVALARVLLRGPDLLVLDEATSALDSAMEERIMASLRRHLAGKTIIVIAHRFSTIRMADHVLVMESGRIAESGPWEKLAARPGVFADLFTGQLEGATDVAPGLGGVVTSP